jgi:hypothetical protein
MYHGKKQINYTKEYRSKIYEPLKSWMVETKTTEDNEIAYTVWCYLKENMPKIVLNKMSFNYSIIQIGWSNHIVFEDSHATVCSFGESRKFEYADPQLFEKLEQAIRQIFNKII